MFPHPLSRSGRPGPCHQLLNSLVVSQCCPSCLSHHSSQSCEGKASGRRKCPSPFAPCRASHPLHTILRLPAPPRLCGSGSSAGLWVEGPSVSSLLVRTALTRGPRLLTLEVQPHLSVVSRGALPAGGSPRQCCQPRSAPGWWLPQAVLSAEGCSWLVAPPGRKGLLQLRSDGPAVWVGLRPPLPHPLWRIFFHYPQGGRGDCSRI